MNKGKISIFIEIFINLNIDKLAISRDSSLLISLEDFACWGSFTKKIRP